MTKPLASGSWTTPVVLPQFNAEDKDRNASFVVDSGGQLHVLVDNENKNVFYTSSTNNGSTWSTPVEIDTAADFRYDGTQKQRRKFCKNPGSYGKNLTGARRYHVGLWSANKEKRL